MPRLLIALLFVFSAAAQSVDLLSVNDFAKDWQISKQFTIAVAQKMPASLYDFKPTPEQMTFGEQMVHIAGSLFSRFHQISGKELPRKERLKQITKDAAIQMLNESFDYVLAVLPALTDQQLTGIKFPVDWVGRSEVNGREMIMNMFVHAAHHRAQCEVYLRLKGITPPAYTF